MKFLAGLVVLFVCSLIVASPAAASDPVFERAFGSGVNGGTGFQNCTTGPVCVVGVADGNAGSMDLPADVVFDNQGGMLVADGNNSRIDRYLVAGDGSVTFDRAFGFGVQAGQPNAFQNCVSNCEAGETSGDAGALDFPWKLAIDSSGRLLVADYDANRVSRFAIAADGTATFDRAFGWDVVPGGAPGLEACTTSCQDGQGAMGAAGSLGGPDGVAVDAAGGILVGEYDNDRISRITISANGTPAFDRAFGLDVNPASGSGFENCTTATGCQPGISGLGETAAGSTANNYDLAIGPDGRIFAANFGNNRVDVFTRATGGEISFDRAFGADVVPAGGTGFETCTTATGCQTGASSGVAGGFDGVTGLEFDGLGGLYVVSEQDFRFSYFKPGSGGGFSFDFTYGRGVNGGTGPEICRTNCVAGMQGTVGGAFDTAQGAAIDGNGRLYIADYESNRIQVFGVGLTVTVSKQLSPSTDPGRFDLKVGAKTVKSAAGNGDSGSVTAGVGPITVSETATSDQNPLSAYTTTIDCGSGPVAGATLTVPNVSSNLNCTVSNTRKPAPPSKADFTKVVLKPRKKTVKAGKKVKLKVAVTNSGGTKGTATVKLTSSAKKKARVPKSVKVTVPAGKTVTKTFKVATKRKKKGKVTIKAKLGKRAARTVLKLKK